MIVLPLPLSPEHNGSDKNPDSSPEELDRECGAEQPGDDQLKDIAARTRIYIGMSVPRCETYSDQKQEAHMYEVNRSLHRSLFFRCSVVNLTDFAAGRIPSPAIRYYIRFADKKHTQNSHRPNMNRIRIDEYYSQSPDMNRAPTGDPRT
jgi:hypothetical protein